MLNVFDRKFKSDEYRSDHLRLQFYRTDLRSAFPHNGDTCSGHGPSGTKGVYPLGPWSVQRAWRGSGDGSARAPEVISPQGPLEGKGLAKKKDLKAPKHQSNIGAQLCLSTSNNLVDLLGAGVGGWSCVCQHRTPVDLNRLTDLILSNRVPRVGRLLHSSAHIFGENPSEPELGWEMD